MLILENVCSFNRLKQTSRTFFLANFFTLPNVSVLSDAQNVVSFTLEKLVLSIVCLEINQVQLKIIAAALALSGKGHLSRVSIQNA